VTPGGILAHSAFRHACPPAHESLSFKRHAEVSATARTNRGIKILGVSLALLNLALWYSVPTMRGAADTLLGRPQGLGNPQILNGVQELFVYFDPWLSRVVFPFIYTFGFVAIAFLFASPQDAAGSGSASVGAVLIAILLLGLETVWLFLIAVAILFRGPDWNFYWPWEPWDGRLVGLNNLNLSQVFWYRWMGQGHMLVGMPWPVREAPGLALAVVYLLLGLLIARTIFRRTGYATAFSCFILLVFSVLAFLHPPELLLWWTVPMTGLIAAVSFLFLWLLGIWSQSPRTVRSMAYWRCVILILLVQVAILVPVKMLLRWTFNLKYLIAVPEYFVNV
jgi:hypothetical protein